MRSEYERMAVRCHTWPNVCEWDRMRRARDCASMPARLECTGFGFLDYVVLGFEVVQGVLHDCAEHGGFWGNANCEAVGR